MDSVERACVSVVFLQSPMPLAYPVGSGAFSVAAVVVTSNAVRRQVGWCPDPWNKFEKSWRLGTKSGSRVRCCDSWACEATFVV